MIIFENVQYNQNVKLVILKLILLYFFSAMQMKRMSCYMVIQTRPCSSHHSTSAWNQNRKGNFTIWWYRHVRVPVIIQHQHEIRTGKVTLLWRYRHVRVPVIIQHQHEIRTGKVTLLWRYRHVRVPVIIQHQHEIRTGKVTLLWRYRHVRVPVIIQHQHEIRTGKVTLLYGDTDTSVFPVIIQHQHEIRTGKVTLLYGDTDTSVFQSSFNISMKSEPER